MVQAPAGFGEFAGALLVGNFGDGQIHAFNPTTGMELGTLGADARHPLAIDGLWGLAFGNGKTAGDANALYHAAGPDDEAHGLFGRITANAPGTNPVTAVRTGDDLAITDSRDSDRVFVLLDPMGTKLNVFAGGQRIGQFDAASVGTIHFSGFAGDDVFVVDPNVTAAVFADGGAGNDVLYGGGGNNVLLGGPGNDLVVGGSGRDVLIGGDGMDRLFGVGNDDILVAGRTAHDGDPAKLAQLLGAWTGTGSYATRVAAIRAGTGGVPKLDATTATDDGSPDRLVGGAGLDWFIGMSPPDMFFGRTAAEQVN